MGVKDIIYWVIDLNSIIDHSKTGCKEAMVVTHRPAPPMPPGHLSVAATVTRCTKLIFHAWTEVSGVMLLCNVWRQV